MRSGIDDPLIEGEDRIILVEEELRDLTDIRIQPDAEEGFLAADILDEFVLIHVAMSV